MALALVLVGGSGLWWSQQRELPPVELPDAEVCLDAPAIAFDPQLGLALTAPRPVPAGARCPVCGMYPGRSLEWAAQVIYVDGYAHFFDSPLSLFLFLQDVGRYSPGRTAQDIAAAYVSDSGQAPSQWVAAADAFFVHGSNALGPMRAGNLPAFAQQAAAQAFAQQRGGVVLAFAQVDAQVLGTLSTTAGHQH